MEEIREETSDTAPINTQKTKNLKTETKIYKRRWIILFTFCIVSFLSAFNWIEHNIIADITIDFYNTSLPEDEGEKSSAVNWLSMVYMLTYIPLVFPAMFLLDRKGLKITIMLGALFNTIGSIIKCFAVNPDLFYIVMIGQTFCAIGQAFTLSVPARLSALWFGSSQIALATSIGVFGNQLGAAIGFLVPPNLVKLGSIDFMETRFYILYITIAGVSLLSLVLAMIFVKNQPDLPPSLSQLEVRNQLLNQVNKPQENDFKIFKDSLVNLLMNFNFLLIFISYGMNVGSFYSISTLLNQSISDYYKNENELIGYFGLILILSGLVGSIMAGLALDKSKKFKLVTLVFYIGTLLAMVLFTGLIEVNLYIIFGTSTLLGFFMSGYLPIGFELASEVTYPEPESTSCGLLNISAQIFGLILTAVQGRIITGYGAIYGNMFICVILLIGAILTGFVKSDLRRQNAVLSSQSKEHMIGNDNKALEDEDILVEF